MKGTKELTSITVPPCVPATLSGRGPYGSDSLVQWGSGRQDVPSGAVAGEPFGAVHSFLYEDTQFLPAVLHANKQ